MQLPSINVEFRKHVADIEAMLLTMPQVDCPLQHDFVDGVYCRTITIPAGTLGTGMIHNNACRSVLLQGKMVVWSEAQGRLEVEAPCIWDSPAGTKRLFAIEEEVVWMTVHKAESVTVPEVEAELYSITYEQYDARLGYNIEGEL